MTPPVYEQFERVLREPGLLIEGRLEAPPEEKRGGIYRSVLIEKIWFWVSALVIGGIKVGSWAWVRSQNRLIIRNEFAQPIANLRISFADSPSRPLTFHNVQNNQEQWQPSTLVRNGSGGASNRPISVEGVTSNGKRISSNGMFDAGFSRKPLVGAPFLVMIIQSDGTIRIYQSSFLSL